ncbi:MAG: histidine kinase [Spirochaetia bacterium]|nr:histidine kinase [Spirochaetia bacterium]MCF7953480.1 histidine kinase [Spirochaetales bacterium]
MRTVKKSLQAQIFLYVFISLIVIVISMSYILFTTMRLQQIVDRQFQTERFYQDLQREIEEIQVPFLDYLSSKSSKALAELLMKEQNLRGMIPENIPISHDPIQLAKREVYSLLESYLDMVEQAVQEKRGRAISEYTSLYENMEQLNSYIVSRIDYISLHGFREQLTGYEKVIQTSRSLQFWNLLVIIFAFLWAISWMLYSLNRVTDPMHKLAQTAGELAQGNFDVPDIHVEAVSEVSSVVEAFNQMKSDIRQYIQEIQKQKTIEQGYLSEKLRNMKMEQLLKRMEFYTMQAQMNPHFLFNTINTGVQLAIVEEADKTAEFMENLAEFFRNNIRERKLFVPLKQEIKGLRSYFYILNIRFPRSLNIELNVQESIDEGCEVPAMILQPLVENSVIHAFKGVDRKGCITVNIWKEEAYINLSVKDNGIGIPSEMAESLLKHLDRSTEYGSKVMGLENVIQRLYFFFPQNDEIITIQTAPNEGTEVLIRIDTREEPCITL